MKQLFEQAFSEWIGQEKLAIEISTLVNNLSIDKGVEVILQRKPMVNAKISEIIYNHKYARLVTGVPYQLSDSLAILQAMSLLNLAPARIDLVRLLHEWHQLGDDRGEVQDFVANQLVAILNKPSSIKSKDVVLFGFGRIGRLVARELIEQAGRGDQLRLRAIVTRGNSDLEIKKRAELLRNDSIHGIFKGTIDEDYENKTLIINGHRIAMINAKNPEDVDYTAYGIEDALLIDNTGVFRDREGLSRHLQANNGVGRVLLTAPGKGDIPNIVFGVNHEQYADTAEQIFSAASCTTNAIVPVLKVINDYFGMEHAHIETIHSYTNDQNLLDNYHKKSRRGRAATVNMVITETGAGSAVAKALPELGGKITGNAVRVPTPDVSLAILNLSFDKVVAKDALLNHLKEASLQGTLIEQIEYSLNDELVSSDIIGNAHASIIDSHATIMSPNGKGAILYVWYDNEYGYTRQVIRLAKQLAGVIRYRYY